MQRSFFAIRGPARTSAYAGPSMDTDIVSQPREPRMPIQDPPALDVIRRLDVTPLSITRWREDQTTVTFVQISDGLSLVDSRGPGHPASRSFYAAHAPGTCSVLRGATRGHACARELRSLR